MYQAFEKRYESGMIYRRCGKSGLKLPAISLGFWHNFGSVDVYEVGRATVQAAFDCGITHFDLANNYGPEPGSAEITFGRIFNQDLKPYRDEIIVSTKAGYNMWPGPYGDWGSRKNLIASCDQSLKRMGLDYVDIFYHHRPDTDTPLEESMLALDHIVRSGRALYVGISNYSPERTAKATAILRELKTPFVIHQMRCNMLDQTNIDNMLLDTLDTLGLGGIAYCPLAQGILTDKYLDGTIPHGSRAERRHFLKPENLTPECLDKVRKLNEMAQQRGQSLPQMAIAWLLNLKGITSALIGAHSAEQLRSTVKALDNLVFFEEELALIREIGGKIQINEH